MEIKEVTKICVFYLILTINIVSTLPTFGDEFVHIKVHVPSEPSNSKSISISKAPVIHHDGPALSNQKVIHHYHRRHKPIMKAPIKEMVPAWENFYLSELDKHPVYYSKHFDHHQQHIEDTFVLKEHHNHYVEESPVKIKTYKVIEEYSHDHHQPYEEYMKTPTEHVKFIKSFYDHNQHHYHQHEHHQELKEFNKTPIETVELLESLDHKNLQQVHQNGHSHHIETAKYEKEEPQYHYQTKNVYRPEKEILQVIQSPKYSAANTQANNHFAHHQKILAEEHIYNDHHKPQTDTINVFKSRPTNSKDHYENYETEYHLLPELIEEDNKSLYYHKAPSINHHETSVSDISIKEHREYEKPICKHQNSFAEINNKYAAPVPTLADAAHHYSSSNGSQHDDVIYGTRDKFAADNRKYLPPFKTPPAVGLSQTENHIAANENAHHSENPLAPETYIGYDSYSAGNVQGVDNSDYSKHTT